MREAVIAIPLTNFLMISMAITAAFHYNSNIIILEHSYE